MTTTIATVRPRHSRRRSLEWIAPAVLVIVAALVAVNLSRALPERHTVTFENHTGAFVTVRAADEDRSGWLGLGTLDPKSSSSFEEVGDQGNAWRFQLTVGPDRIAEIRRTGHQLRSADWKVTIPAQAADSLPLNRRSG